MGKRLEGKIAIITGSAKGIGKAIAELFIEEGATVIATSRSQRTLQEAKKSFDAIAGKEVDTMVADTTNVEQVKEAVDFAIEKYGRIDILINNAGMNVFDDPLTLSLEQWERCFDINLKGAWNCTSAVLPYFVKQQYGNVVNIASVHGLPQ